MAANKALCGLVAFMLAGMVISTPVHPGISLTDMSADNACLFVCNICFDGHFDLMMTCANKICRPGMNGLGFIWVGHHCKNYNLMEKYMTK
ncbi:uncharacterized protein LOC121372149 [Gigantopelta aegis]|uniref:uncharacterized protein LOC121372149 n=1 Tax=Gigantopelta aegis TaxID=1735272 RepID=UPI001B88A370|nr:uncharacterized protein LOC121372149 [Gigantopelta aegis]